MKAIELCVARFDEDTKTSFLDLYTKIDAGILETEEEEADKKADPPLDGIDTPSA